jgi:enoyl-CoA hydratase/carnithine racemase
MNLGTDIDEIITSFDAGILSIGMNRPDKKNALFGAMYTRMSDLIEAAGKESSVRVIYLSGTRECFSSGNDVSTFSAGSEEGGMEDLPSVRFLRTIAHSNVPIVAAVNGPAIGVGTTMLMHCDFVVAGEEALFQTPFVTLGVSPEAASSYLMPLRMGHDAAARMLMLAEKFSAGEAVECGLASVVYPVEAYQEEALKMARKMAELPPTSLRSTKQVMRAPLLQGIDEAMQVENRAFASCMESPEFTEAITAFMQRRAPDFSKF